MLPIFDPIASHKTQDTLHYVHRGKNTVGKILCNSEIQFPCYLQLQQYHERFSYNIVQIKL